MKPVAISLFKTINERLRSTRRGLDTIMGYGIRFHQSLRPVNRLVENKMPENRNLYDSLMKLWSAYNTMYKANNIVHCEILFFKTLSH